MQAASNRLVVPPITIGEYEARKSHEPPAVSRTPRDAAVYDIVDTEVFRERHAHAFLIVNEVILAHRRDRAQAVALRDGVFYAIPFDSDLSDVKVFDALRSLIESLDDGHDPDVL